VRSQSDEQLSRSERIIPLGECGVSSYLSALIHSAHVRYRRGLISDQSRHKPTFFVIVCIVCLITQLSYPNRLTKCNLQSLEIRRLHCDPVMTYLILFGKMSVNIHDFFSHVNSSYNTRGHCFKLFTQHCRVNTRKFFCVERVVEPRNSMPATGKDFSIAWEFSRHFLKQSILALFLTVSLSNWNLLISWIIT